MKALVTTIVSLAELEACLRGESWLTRREIEERLNGNVVIPLGQGMQSGTIISRETLQEIQYSLNEGLEV